MVDSPVHSTYDGGFRLFKPTSEWTSLRETQSPGSSQRFVPCINNRRTDTRPPRRRRELQTLECFVCGSEDHVGIDHDKACAKFPERFVKLDADWKRGTTILTDLACFRCKEGCNICKAENETKENRPLDTEKMDEDGFAAGRKDYFENPEGPQPRLAISLHGSWMSFRK